MKSLSLLLRYNGGEITLRKIHELLTNRVRLMEILKNCTDESIRAPLLKSLATPEKEREERMIGLISQIEPLTKGELGDLLNSTCGDRSLTPDSDYLDFSLSEILRATFPPTLVVISIPTLKFQESGRIIGKILLQEIAWCVGERSTSGGYYHILPVFLDEFSAFVYDGFQDLLNKARSAQIPLHLSHQSLGDFEAISPAFAKSVNTNTKVKVLLGLNDPETADFFARHLGTSTMEKITERGREESGIFGKRRERSGDLSIRDVESYKIHPNRLKNYNHGQGVIHFPTKDGFLTEEIQFERL